MLRPILIHLVVGSLVIACWCNAGWSQAVIQSTVELSPAGKESYDRGRAELERSDFEGAIRSFSQVIALHQDYADAYTARAAAHQGHAQKIQDPAARELATQKALSDRNHAKQLRAESKLALEPREFGIPRYAPLAALVYLAAWGLLIYFWREKRFPIVWPILGFLFCGPIALLFLGLYVIGAAANPPEQEKEFADHPLEVTLTNRIR